MRLYKEILTIRPCLVGAVYYNKESFKNESAKRFSFKLFRGATILRTFDVEVPNGKEAISQGLDREVGQRILHRYRENLLIGAWLD